MNQNNPPIEATDLYAWGVEYCEARGIPLGYIRIHWETDQTNREGWQFNPEKGWYQRRWSRHNDSFKDYPGGFYLSFDASQDAENYGLVASDRFDGRGVVWVQPGHEFRLVAYKEKGIRVACRLCSHNETIQFNTSSEYQEAVKEPSQLIPIPPNIQLPACIRRHNLIEVYTQHEFKIDGDDAYHWQGTCSGCGTTFKTEILEKDLRGMRMHELRQYDPKIFIKDWTIKLGRCPGPPITPDNPNLADWIGEKNVY